MNAPLKLEKAVLALVALLFLGLSLLDTGLWHPGFAYLDEGSQVAYVQLWLEGQRQGLDLFHGNLHRSLAAALAWAFGPSLWHFRVLSLAALALECWLLYLLTASLFGRRAAAWALVALLACAQTFLRARSLLSFTLLPAELLLLLMLMRREWGSLGSLLFGAGTGLMLADYEGWMLGLPVLALFWLAAPKGERPRLWPLLLGFAAVLSLLSWQSSAWLDDYLWRRQRSLPHGDYSAASLLWQYLKAFFTGGDCIGYLGVSARPFVAAWTLPALLAGAWLAWKRSRMALIWALLFLLPGVSIAAAAEPNRALPFLPALAMLSGAGLGWMAGRAGLWLPLLLLLPGAAWEASGYRDSMRVEHPRWYADSAAAMQLAAEKPESMLFCEISGEYSAQWRYLWYEGKGDGGSVHLLNRESLGSLGPAAASARALLSAPFKGSLAVLHDPPSELEARLRRVDGNLRSLRQPLPHFDFKGRLEGLARFMGPGRDPLENSASLDEALRLSSSLGRLDGFFIKAALELPQSSSTAPLWLAGKARESGDAPLAARLCRRALEIDAARPCP